MDQLIKDLATKARKAGRYLAASDYSTRVNAVLAIADALVQRKAEILAANERDIAKARESGMVEPLIDRLLLTSERIDGIANAARKVSRLPDPLQQTLRERTLENGLHLRQVSVPFGVIGMIYEARPNVTVDAAVILLMSGNAALLRGSASASESNSILIAIMKDALATTTISPEVIQQVPSDDRNSVTALLHARGSIDLVIPRGSAELIRMVVNEARVPTIETGAGVCHVYFDESAEEKIAIPILINAKTQRPSVCNAAETLLVHQARVKDLLPAALKALHAAHVTLHCDTRSLAIASELNIPATLATDEHFTTEYGVLEMNVAVVDSLEAASEHISEFGTQHTEAIITESSEAARRFIALSDCAAVMVNASTRFTDGEEMGFGAEIGISNQKLHARGPMGLEEMTTTTWIVSGTGQIR
jgi:glutamate-5-semialdehyde dehydrogenase